MDNDSEDGYVAEENYYMFLNLPKNASTEQISNSYRNLSRQFHPDKHQDEESKQKAELLFNRTKRAYEVLSDPHKRAIYDSLGTKGLQADGWEIVHRMKTPAEIRAEYESIANAREERRLQQRTNPKGNVTININATELFSDYIDEYDDDRGLPLIEVSGMSISQAIEAPMNRRDTILLSGNLSSSNGNGTGNFVISGRRLINKGWLEIDVGAGQGPALGIKGLKNITDRIFINGAASVNVRPNGLLPGFITSLGVQLDKHTIGYLTYNGGMQSSMSTVIENNTDKQAINATILIGVPHCYLSASYTRKFFENDLKLKLAGKVGTFGFMAEYGAEKKVSKYSSVVATVSVGVPTGVMLRLKVIRGNQTYVFPIHLADDIIPAAVFYATLTPLLTYFVIKKVIIDPMNEDKKRSDLEKAKKINKERIAEKRKEAEMTIELMEANYQRVVLEEQQQNGLIIEKALYGHFASDDESDEETVTIDVTVPVQCLVKSSKLFFNNSDSKSELPGFYDPCIGKIKKLQIQYKCRGISATVFVADEEVARLPAVSTSVTRNLED